MCLKHFVVKTTFIVIGILFIVILLLGLILRKKGTPYNQVVLALHKICSVALFILMAVKFHKLILTGAFSLPFTLYLSMCIAAIILIATGALLSSGNPFKLLLVSLHRIFSIVLTALVIAIFISA